MAAAVAVMEHGRRLAAGQDRPDLARQLAAAQSRLVEQVVPVVVVGEFKRGKSTLVNALLQRSVCPVDADVVTAVPTLVRYGEQPRASAYVETEGGGEPREEEVPIDAIADYVSESGNPGNRRQVRSVDVRLRHRMLRAGLCLVDTPGVGGLDSAHGLITLSALDAANAMLFVTDASQELTRPELEFLLSALRRCPVAACVVTKTDLYPEWRRIVSLNESHLRAAGIDLRVIPVSSFLRLGAVENPALSDESGFRGLVEFLAGPAVRRSADLATDTAVRDIRFVAAQIGRRVEAERTVLERPQQAERLVAGLAGAAQKAARLAAPTATWQQELSDRIQDLVADVEHDLQERLRQILRDTEAVIDASDPKTSWDDIEAWLRREVVSAAVANYETLAARAEDLAASVAEQFDLEAGTRFSPSAGMPSEALATLQVGGFGTEPGASQLTTVLLTVRTSAFLPMVLFGVAGSLLGTVVAAPVSLALGAGIGRKIIRDERQRQVVHRRQQAKATARRYLDEVAFVVGKDSRDGLRRTQRQLRDEFQTRAAALHRSTATALSAAERARRLAPEQRVARAAELAAESGQLRRLRAEVEQLADAGAPR